jgi:hypothetical protein
MAGIVQAHEGHNHGKAKPATARSAKAALPAATVTKVTFTGELIDTQCWFTHNGEGKDHAACAVRCAKGGQDLAFLDQATGEVHTIIAAGHGTNPNEGLYEHVGIPVRVRGTLYKRGPNRGLLLENVTRAQ